MDEILQSESFILWGVPALVCVLMIVLLLLLGDDEGAKLRKRVKGIQQSTSKKPLSVQQAISIRRKNADSEIQILDQMIKKLLPRPEILRNLIARSGLKITVATYLSICLSLMAVGTLAALASPFAPAIAAPLAGLSLGIGIPYTALKFLAARRKSRFVKNFPEAIDLMVRGLKSGLPMGESIKIVSEELPDPIGIEFAQINDQVRIGKKLEEAMAVAGERLALQEFNFMTVAMSIQAETGGNLAETLSNLSNVLRKRRQLRMKIKALSSEAKASAYIIGSLPFIMTGLIHLTNAGYLAPLWNDPRGHMSIAGGLLWFAMGIGIMYKMVKFEI